MYDYTKRKLNKAELEKYGSYENFRKLQEEYLDSREALGFDVRTFVQRHGLDNDEGVPVKTYKPNGKTSEYLDDRDRSFNTCTKDLIGLASQWSEDSYLVASGLYDFHDVYQEVCIAWTAAYDSFKGRKKDDSTFRTWFNKCVFNHMLDIKRKIKNEIDGTVTFGWLPERGSDPVVQSAVEKVESNLKRRDVLKILRDTIPSKREQLVVMLYFGLNSGSGSSEQDVSDMLDIPRRTISDILNRVVNNPDLKEALINSKLN